MLSVERLSVVHGVRYFLTSHCPCDVILSAHIRFTLTNDHHQPVYNYQP